MKQTIKLLIDSANIADITEAISWGSFSGVTTNPILLSKETKNYKEYILKLLKIIPQDWEISLEVKATTADDMVKQARILASWDNRIRVKLPVTIEGLIASTQLVKEMPLNMTVVKLAGQAMMCQALAIKTKPKDMVLSIFCGRINQAGYDWKDLIESISKVDWPGKILAASIKTPYDISEAIRSGAEIITAPLDDYKMALNSKIVFEDVDLFNTPFDGDRFSIK